MPRLFGMPPIPQLGASPPSSGTVPKIFGKTSGEMKAQTTTTPSGNIFASALQKSGVSKHPFSSPSGDGDNATTGIKAKASTGANPFRKPSSIFETSSSGGPPVVLKRPTTVDVLPEKPDLFKSVPQPSSDTGNVFASSASSAKSPFDRDEPPIKSSAKMFTQSTSPPTNVFAVPKTSDQKSIRGIFGGLESASSENTPAANPFMAGSVFSKPAGGIKSRLGKIPSVIQEASEKEDVFKRASDEFSGSEEGSSVEGSVSDGKTLQRLTSKEELQAIKSIVCEQVLTHSNIFF